MYETYETRKMSYDVHCADRLESTPIFIRFHWKASSITKLPILVPNGLGQGQNCDCAYDVGLKMTHNTDIEHSTPGYI